MDIPTLLNEPINPTMADIAIQQEEFDGNNADVDFPHPFDEFDDDAVPAAWTVSRGPDLRLVCNADEAINVDYRVEDAAAFVCVEI